MKKRMLSRMLATLMVLGSSLGVFAGCTPGNSSGNGDGTVDLDPNKEVINVSLFSAGFGTQWLTDMLNSYNQTLTGNYQFNRIAENTDSIDTITDQITAGVYKADIYFNDESNFQKLIRMDKLLDLTAIWDEKVDGDNRTVRSKILDSEIFEKAYSYQNKIYGLPFSQGVSGIIYDHDFFVDSKFLKEDATTANGLSVGIDGKEGTFDDGLPTTMTEFKQLCDLIRSRGFWPFLYTDTVGGGITTPVLEIVAGMYEGMESYKTTVVYEGKYTSPSTGLETTITPEEGYKVFELGEGRYKALEFMNEFLLNENYYDTSLEGINHTASEERFIYSHSKGQTRVAMTLNGCWWDNEAKPAFATDAKRNGAKWGYGKRDFRFMPIPAIDGQSETMNGKTVFSTNADGSVFAIKSSNDEKNQAILDFLKYFTSDEGLSFFASATGSLPAYRFEMGENVNNLTPFSRNFYEIMMSENVEILRPTLLEQLTPICYLSTDAPRRWEVTIDSFEYELAYEAITRTSMTKYVDALKNKYDATSWNKIYQQVAGVL